MQRVGWMLEPSQYLVHEFPGTWATRALAGQEAAAMNVFLAQPLTRRVEPAAKQGFSSGHGMLQQDGRRQPGAAEDFSAVLARLTVRPA